jgi:hypothetical protein
MLAGVRRASFVGEGSILIVIPANPQRGQAQETLFSSEAGHPISSVFGFSDIARVPLTQRAFRSSADARVTFLLLAQKKSNPKKMAFKSESPAA